MDAQTKLQFCGESDSWAQVPSYRMLGTAQHASLIFFTALQKALCNSMLGMLLIHYE